MDAIPYLKSFDAREPGNMTVVMVTHLPEDAVTDYVTPKEAKGLFS